MNSLTPGLTPEDAVFFDLGGVIFDPAHTETISVNNPCSHHMRGKSLVWAELPLLSLGVCVR